MQMFFESCALRALEAASAVGSASQYSESLSRKISLVNLQVQTLNIRWGFTRGVN